MPGPQKVYQKSSLHHDTFIPVSRRKSQLDMATTPALTISLHPFNSPEGRDLVAKLNAELDGMYPDWNQLTLPKRKGNPEPSKEESKRHDAVFKSPSDFTSKNDES